MGILRFLFLVLWRLCIPFSLVVAFVLAPITMLTNLKELPHAFMSLWDGP